jgi:hypothetical protein
LEKNKYKANRQPSEVINFEFDSDAERCKNFDNISEIPSNIFRQDDFFTNEKYIKPHIKRSNFDEDLKEVIKKTSNKNIHEDIAKKTSNVNTVSKYKEIKEFGQNNIQKNMVDSDNSEDLDVELEGSSKQITDFQQSINDAFKKTSDKIERNRMSVISESNECTHTEYPHNSRSMANPKDNKPLHMSMIDKDQTDIKQIKEESYKLKLELEDTKTKLDRRTKEYLDYKNKVKNLEDDLEDYKAKITEQKLLITRFQSEAHEKEGVIANLKMESNKKENIISDMINEVNGYRTQVENIKNEFNNNRNELAKKSEKINELQQKNFQLEQENQEYRSKHNNENFKEIKLNYDALRQSYLELKGQNELINIKLQNANDENFNLKRDIIYLEKEVNIKSDTLNKYKNELLHSNRTIERNKESIKSDKQLNFSQNQFGDLGFNSISQGSRVSESSFNTPIKLDKGINKKKELNHSSTFELRSSDRNMNVFPSQKNIIEKESRILEIETQLYTHQQEREKV